MQAALTLLAQIGDGFTMEQLAEQAQVPRATLYRRVGSKVALLQRLAQEQGVALTPQRSVRVRILLATRQVIGRTGLVNASIEQIAEQAEVGVATIYRHFGDKEHLIQTMIEELSPRSFVSDMAQVTADVAADLLRLTSTLLPYAYNNRDILRIILTANEAERTYIEHLRVGSVSTLDQLTGFFTAQVAAGYIASGAPPRELALAYLGLLFAFTVFGPNHYGVLLEDPDHISALIVQLFLHGLQVRS